MLFWSGVSSSISSSKPSLSPNRSVASSSARIFTPSNPSASARTVISSSSCATSKPTNPSLSSNDNMALALSFIFAPPRLTADTSAVMSPSLSSATLNAVNPSSSSSEMSALSLRCSALPPISIDSIPSSATTPLTFFISVKTNPSPSTRTARASPSFSSTRLVILLM